MALQKLCNIYFHIAREIFSKLLSVSLHFYVIAPNQPFSKIHPHHFNSYNEFDLFLSAAGSVAIFTI